MSDLTCGYCNGRGFIPSPLQVERFIPSPLQVERDRLAAQLQPRRIEAVEELDALPNLTVILSDFDGVVLQLIGKGGRGGGWFPVGGIRAHTAVSPRILPATVLYTPGAREGEEPMNYDIRWDRSTDETLDREEL